MARILFTLLLALLVSGCGGRDGGPVTIRVVVWKPNNAEAWEKVLDRFHDTHPGIRVEREIAPNNSSQLHDLLAQKLPSERLFLGAVKTKASGDDWKPGAELDLAMK